MEEEHSRAGIAWKAMMGHVHPTLQVLRFVTGVQPALDAVIKLQHPRATSSPGKGADGEDVPLR